MAVVFTPPFKPFPDDAMVKYELTNAKLEHYALAYLFICL